MTWPRCCAPSSTVRENHARKDQIVTTAKATGEQDVDVLIIGGGPVGMLLAAELRLGGVPAVTLAERLTERSPHSKAFGLHARSLESLDRRGLAERFRQDCRSWSNGHFAGLDEWVDFSLLSSEHNYSLLSEQTRSERLLEEHAIAAGVQVRRGREVTMLRQDSDHVEATVTSQSGQDVVRARYAVGCDGAQSFVRGSTGIGFPGAGGKVTARMGDVILPDRGSAPMGMERTSRGLLFCVPLDDTYHRLATFDFKAGKRPTGELTMAELSASLHEIWGSDLGAHSPRWLSVFSDSACQAERFRDGRILLAGDAAHTHFPVGGQGLNLGIQDAFNLGWKLAATVLGWAPEGLLDTYDAERQPPARQVLSNTRAQIALMDPDPYVTDMRDLFTGLMRKREVNLALAEMLSGVTVRYSVTSGNYHRLTGVLAPDLKLSADYPDNSLAVLLRRGTGVLLNLGARRQVDETIREWAGPAQTQRVRHVVAACDQEPGLEALLVRPDGYVAWAADQDATDDELREGLHQALRQWFGAS
jgi:2-polyprenyl-6-methoxyphenol hydroxylase-like FAD-dependent oxidoreductase